MVVTQLQLKWPNHSTQLLTGLKYLFKNEQLVDCTLKCNKHTLKVHRSVLAACSPYFERELENSPFIVIEDMQFNVLQALIEFMYYGETRITEENLTSLIEAAKLFEIKGLSEMDLLTSNDNATSSLVKNRNTIENVYVSENANDAIFENKPYNAMAKTTSALYNQEAITRTVFENCQNDLGEDSNSTSSSLLVDSNENASFSNQTTAAAVTATTTTTTTTSSSNRNFVVTPPQTESAQILLSLARPYNQKSSANGLATGHERATTTTNSDLLNDPAKVVDCNGIEAAAADNILIDTQGRLVIDDTRSLANDGAVKREQQEQNESMGKVSRFENVAAADSSLTATFDVDKSLLAKLLTRNANPNESKTSAYDETYKHLFDTSPSTTLEAKDRNDECADEKSKTFELQPENILDCPFLIETNNGYVDLPVVDNMFTVYDNGQIFECERQQAVKSDVTMLQQRLEAAMTEYNLLFERIRTDTEQVLKNDPEAVVLSRLNGDGVLEKYVLTSADVKKLAELNERRRKAETALSEAAMPHLTQFEIESPLNGSGTSMITRIINCDRLTNAISKLPLLKNDQPTVATTQTSEARVNERILNESALADHHHHENMFDELDTQFNLGCSIENMQREYVAYEEASRNETQLEHNYYANAIRDENEECAAVIAESYDLKSMMLIEEPLVNGDGLITLAAATSGGDGGSVAISTNNKTKTNSVVAYHLINAQDAYLNGNKKEQNARRNGLIEKTTNAATVFNGKCDLIASDDDVLVGTSSSQQIELPSKSKITATNGSSGAAASVSRTKLLKSNDKRTNALRSGFDNVNTLPFKSVKNTSKSQPKPRKTYKRKMSASSVLTAAKVNRIEDQNMNGMDVPTNSVAQEVIVDEIS